MMNLHNNKSIEPPRAHNDADYLEETVEQAERMMRQLLFWWLTPRSRQRVQQFVKYYHPQGRLELYYAMMRYIMTGQRTKFGNGCAQWHFHLFCDDADNDRYSANVHTRLMNLWKEIGAITPIDCQQAATKPLRTNDNEQQ